MTNVRNARTTHPRKRARRQGALDRFTVDEARAGRDEAYAIAKAKELRSLHRSLGVVVTPPQWSKQ